MVPCSYLSDESVRSQIHHQRLRKKSLAAVIQAMSLQGLPDSQGQVTGKLSQGESSQGERVRAGYRSPEATDEKIPVGSLPSLLTLPLLPGGFCSFCPLLLPPFLTAGSAGNSPPPQVAPSIWAGSWRAGQPGRGWDSRRCQSWRPGGQE